MAEMSNQELRDFYRKCKEDAEYYLRTVPEEKYRFIYELVGPPMTKFVNFEGKECKEFLNNFILYLANKMNELAED